MKRARAIGRGEREEREHRADEGVALGGTGAASSRVSVTPVTRVSVISSYGA